MNAPPKVPGESTTQKRRRSLKRRRLRLLLDLMGREQTPERVAAAVALGVGVGLSPFIGFHFILAIVLAFLFRLNKLDTVLGSFAGNPWTLPPLYALGFRLGRWVLGYSPAAVPALRWHRILHADFWVAFRGPSVGPRLASFLIGTTVLAVVAGVATYADVPRPPQALPPAASEDRRPRRAAPRAGPGSSAARGRRAPRRADPLTARQRSSSESFSRAGG